MTRPKRRYRAALAGYYGFGNLGDELLADAAIAALERCGIGREEMVLFSGPDAPLRKGLDTVDRWSFSAVRRSLLSSDTLLLGGGGLFQDVTSWRSCLYYWGLVRMASACGAVPWALGQSVGPLRTPVGRRFAGNALKRCRVVQVRDAASLEECRNFGICVDSGHDLVLSLGSAFTGGETEGTKSVPEKILVNLRPASGGLAERFAEALSGAASTLGGELLGVAMSEEDHILMEKLIGSGKLPDMEVVRPSSLAEAVELWRGAAAAAGMRLHFCVVSLLARTPFFAVPYDPKVRSFAEAYGIPVWQGGKLPSFSRADPAAVFPFRFLQDEIDLLCRKVLG